jgi:VRR-NUC domain
VNEIAPRRRRQQHERLIQAAVVQHLQLRAPSVFYYHIANGGYRTPSEGAAFRATGVVRGMPDLAFIISGRAYFLELKSERGRLSDDQRACHQRLRENGAVVLVAAGIDEAISAFEEIGILPSTTSRRSAA